MFARIIDAFINIIDLFFFAVVVDEFEGGVILRLGKYQRDLKPGINFYWPLSIETYMSDNIVLKTEGLNSQSLTTKCGTTVLIGVFISYWIRNKRRWLLEVEDADSVLADLTYGVIGRQVAQTNWEDIYRQEFQDKVYDELKVVASKKLGVTLDGIQFSDLTKSKTLRIVQE